MLKAEWISWRLLLSDSKTLDVVFAQLVGLVEVDEAARACPDFVVIFRGPGPVGYPLEGGIGQA